MSAIPSPSAPNITWDMITRELEKAKAAGDFDAAFRLGCAAQVLVDRRGKQLASKRSAERRSSEAAARTEWYQKQARAIWERNPGLRRSHDRTAEVIIDEIKKLPIEDVARLLRGKSTIRRAIKSL